MIVDLIRLKNDVEEFIPVSFEKNFSKEELEGSGILELSDLKVEGDITKTAIDDFFLHVTINGTLVLPSSLTLKPVKYPISVLIEGNLLEMLEEIDENVKKIENTIDIFPIIWENILMEIPMRVVNPEEENVSLKGDGCKLITEEETLPNEGLAKLKDLWK